MNIISLGEIFPDIEELNQLEEILKNKDKEKLSKFLDDRNDYLLSIGIVSRYLYYLLIQKFNL